MSFLGHHQIDLGSDSQEDAQVSIEVLHRKVKQIQQTIDNLDPNEHRRKTRLVLDLANIHIQLEDRKNSWAKTFPLLQEQIEMQNWQTAVEVCDLLFRCDQPDSLVALGHGLWLSITFPIESMLTVSQLQHVIDETPVDSDGAAVAAAVASYVVELREEPNSSSDAVLAANRMFSDVARRHGNVHSQETFDQWANKLELHDPAKFLVRMRNIIDVLVQDQWWIDRDALQMLIPD